MAKGQRKWDPRCLQLLVDNGTYIIIYFLIDSLDWEYVIDFIHEPHFSSLITHSTHDSPRYLEGNLASEKLKGFFSLNYEILSLEKCLN